MQVTFMIVHEKSISKFSFWYNTKKKIIHRKIISNKFSASYAIQFDIYFCYSHIKFIPALLFKIIQKYLITIYNWSHISITASALHNLTLWEALELWNIFTHTHCPIILSHVTLEMIWTHVPSLCSIERGMMSASLDTYPESAKGMWFGWDKSWNSPSGDPWGEKWLILQASSGCQYLFGRKTVAEAHNVF